MFFSTVSLLTLAATALAKPEVFVINVGHNKTANATTVFQPERVNASVGDIVVFNFTLGTHSAIQSDFASPCIPIAQTNGSINGFDSGARPAGNGTTITTLNYTVTSNSTPVWFYDATTCGEGGVGAINSNESSTATLAGFVRNAIRLNGTASSNASLSSASSASKHSPTSTGSSASSSNTAGSGSSSGAGRVGVSVGALLLAAAGVTLF